MKLFTLILALLCALVPSLAIAAAALPAAVQSQAGAPLSQVGSGSYKKLGFNIYEASLWAPDAAYSAEKPSALKLRYTKALSKKTIVDTAMENIRDQKKADAKTLTAWDKQLRKILPAVKNGDELTGLRIPTKGSVLFLNGKQIAKIEDQALSDAFFAIWLGEGADATLRSQLLANKG